MSHILLHSGRPHAAKSRQVCSLRRKQCCQARRVTHRKTLGKVFFGISGQNTTELMHTLRVQELYPVPQNFYHRNFAFFDRPWSMDKADQLSLLQGESTPHYLWSSTYLGPG